MTLKDIELELIELRKEHEAMAEVVKHHVKNFDKLRNWHKLESQANVVVKTKIVERIYKKLAIECLKKMEAPEFAALEIINAELDEEDKEIMADIAKII